MSLFQKSVEKKYLSELDKALIDKKFAEFQEYFGNAAIQENIRNAKEEQFQEGFLRELFVKIFDYTLNPQPNFNLTTELKNISNSKKADGAILRDENAIAVIELKSTDTTDLTTVETQAFGYKNHHPKCVYVITSNFEKLRFYIQNAVYHLEFDLFKLSKEDFSLMWLCLAKGSLLIDLPLKIKESSVVQEENITKLLYSYYSKFREAIFRNLVENNPTIDKLLLFKKTQKLIDRFLFIFFAEDKQLLPPNSINEIVQQWDELKDKYDEYFPLYDRFKKYFGYLNTGYVGKKYSIYAYNGGLFTPDEILDNISIDDNILREHTLKLSNYDFDTDVDVNILGHIFEHSLGEIENVEAEIKGEKVEQEKTRRKKDGIFYTPKYITKYIVENTIGKLCDEKRKELEIIDEEYAKGRKNRKKETIKVLDEKLKKYREWLLSLTILDPACGSGAFLNQALEFLIAEHKKIDELNAQLFGAGLVFSDITTDILEKNIFGVDLNEESVEIAKLSLWLRTAQKGRKLNTLSNNIKCGNSLIDDLEIAGEKAFNWQKEFPDIFAKGGFDVVIGNPPYVRMQNIEEHSRVYFSNKYKTAYKNYDLYVLFAEKSKYLININGIVAYIMPKKFITAEYGDKLKELLYEENLLKQFVDFSDFQIFEDATTYTGIFILNKSQKKEFLYQKIKDDITQLFEYDKLTLIDYSNLSSKNWIFLDKHSANLFNKLSKNERLKQIDISLFVGLQTSADSVYILEISEDKLYSKYTNKYYTFSESDIIKPLLKGAEIKRYLTPIPNYKLIFPYRILDSDFEIISQKEMETNYPDIWEYLNECRLKLESRENGKMRNEKWYGYVYLKNMTEFSKPKILTQVLCKESSLSLDLNNKFYFVGGGTAGGYGIEINQSVNEYAMISILNSKLIQWYIQQFASPFQGGFYAYNKYTLGEVPISNNAIKSLDFKPFVEKITSSNDELQEISLKFQRTIQRKFALTVLPNKLQDWHLLSYAEFIAELGKKKVKLSLSDEAEWEVYFLQESKKALEIKTKIETTDKEIDQMVYKLYDLTEEEIKIIEKSK